MTAKYDYLPKIVTNPELVQYLRDVAQKYPLFYHCPFPESWPKVLLNKFPQNVLLYETFNESHLTYPEKKPDGSLRAQTVTVYHMTPTENDFYIRPIMAVETAYQYDPELGHVFGIDSGKIFHEMVASRHTASVSIQHFKNFLESVCDHLLQKNPIDTIKFDTRRQCMMIVEFDDEN